MICKIIFTEFCFIENFCEVLINNLFNMDQRLLNEIEHGRKIVNITEKVWNWDTPAGIERWNRRTKMLTSHIKPEMEVLEVGCALMKQCDYE